MRRASSLTVTARAIIGVVALYGLLLQGFLAAATPFGLSSLGVICAPHDGAGPSSPDAPARHDHACCTVAAPAVATPPEAPATLVAWTPPPVRIAWRPEAEQPRTGPPARPGSARGPPTA